MASFRRRFEEVQEADTARTKLIEDLLNKVDDLNKTMDRNAFVLVLIDGDGMNFNDDLIKKGIAGGEEASQRLRREVFNALRNSPDFRHDSRIVIKIYMNMRGLSKLYTQYGLLSKIEDFGDFVLGFNKSHPLCDAIDAGNHKEGADKKIQETLNLYLHNVHCKHIIFGASADNSYASYLGSFHDIDISSRIQLLEGPPFAAEFKTILPRFRQIRFPEVFRSTKIDITQRQFSQIKKSALETPIRNWPAARDLVGPDTSAAIDSFLSPKGPAVPFDRGLPMQLADRTVQSSPPKSIFTQLVRPVSPSKRFSDTVSGGVSLRPREQSYETAALLRLANKLTQASQPAPTTERVEKALIKATLETLADTPRSCDFANVKRRAETKLGVDANIWGNSEEDFWFSRSKKLIKWTVEQWLIVTDNPLPGNATWLFKHIPGGKSTSMVLQRPNAQEWRTETEPGWQKIFDKVAAGLDLIKT